LRTPGLVFSQKRGAPSPMKGKEAVLKALHRIQKRKEGLKAGGFTKNALTKTPKKEGNQRLDETGIGILKKRQVS